MDSPLIANVRDLPWMTSAVMGDVCMFEDDEHRFTQIGYSLAVLQPGQRGAQYHRELDNQEDFLVLAGECIAIIEGREHHLERWDFVHCPAGVAHGFVATGEEPCILFMSGARQGKRYRFVRDELALRHGIGVEVDTDDQNEAYAALPKWRPGTSAL